MSTKKLHHFESSAAAKENVASPCHTAEELREENGNYGDEKYRELEARAAAAVDEKSVEQRRNGRAVSNLFKLIGDSSQLLNGNGERLARREASYLWREEETEGKKMNIGQKAGLVQICVIF
ncbi:unnamed protein product [Linum trigynum]|uniref:Uncharacterized protein n=1 Tax=Linum trigynum TaxID=586398 RepID=A0AAV2EIT4_9ROSI